MKQESGDDFFDIDPFEIEFAAREKKRKSKTDGGSRTKRLRPDAFADFVVPDNLNALIKHLDELTGYGRQRHTLTRSSTRVKSEDVPQKKEPWDGNEPLTYVTELLHDSKSKALPATLVADDYEAVRYKQVSASEVGLRTKQRTPQKKDVASKDGESKVDALWRRRLVWSVLLSTSDIESKNAKKIQKSLKAELTAVHRAILLAASLAKNFATAKGWQAYLDEAAELRQQGNTTGGHKRWEARAPYHKKVMALARAYWKKNPGATESEVSRGIIEKLYTWIDTQIEMCDDPKPRERSLAAYITRMKEEILPSGE